MCGERGNSPILATPNRQVAKMHSMFCWIITIRLGLIEMFGLLTPYDGQWQRSQAEISQAKLFVRSGNCMKSSNFLGQCFDGLAENIHQCNPHVLDNVIHGSNSLDTALD